MEADIAGVLTEALTAQVQAVLADQGSGLAADTAIQGGGVVSKDIIKYHGITSRGNPCRTHGGESTRR